MVFVNYLFMCLIFGTTFLAIKIGVDSGLPPFFSAGLRFFIAGLILFLIMIVTKKTQVRLFFHKEMFLTGVCLTFGTFATLYWAEQYVTSGVAAILSATGPIMILLIQNVILKEKGNRLSYIGCLLGISGVIFLILPIFTVEISPFWAIGCVAIIIGEIFYATGTIYTKKVITKFQHTSPIALNAVQMMHGGMLLLLLSLVIERGQYDFTMNLASASSFLYLVVFGSMIGHTLFYWLVARTNPVFPSTWLFISPVIAVLVGVVFYQEYLSWVTVVGTVTIITGTIIVNFNALQSMWKKKLVLKRGFKY
ncbi:DMT family transporter [Fredinandcohnia humi]